jgi:RNA polymerase sigma-70 factor (ECF subfamily)
MTKNEYKIFFETHYSRMCRYAFAIVHDHDEAEDIVQGVFVEFWKKEDKDDITANFENYLIRAVKFKCIDFQRKLVVKRKYEAEAVHEQAYTEEEDDNQEELKQAMHKAISELPEKTKEVFMMSKLDGLSYKEIADNLEISPKTVENQMGRAFKHLREKLKKHPSLMALLIFIFFG